jgi:hypothetical protein
VKGCLDKDLTPRLDLYIKQRRLWKRTKWFGAGPFQPPLAFLPALGDRDMSTLICDFESLAPHDAWDVNDEPCSVCEVIIAGIFVCTVLAIVTMIVGGLTIGGRMAMAMIPLMFIELLVVLVIGFVIYACYSCLKSRWIRARIAASDLKGARSCAGARTRAQRARSDRARFLCAGVLYGKFSSFYAHKILPCAPAHVVRGPNRAHPRAIFTCVKLPMFYAVNRGGPTRRKSYASQKSPSVQDLDSKFGARISRIGGVKRIVRAQF